MGIELVLGGLALGTAAEGVAQQRKAEKQRKAGREVSRASQVTAAIEQRRQSVREERVRRARILASSEATGVSGSSGESGAISSLATNFGHNLGVTEGQTLASGAISGYNQKAANADYNARLFGEVSNLFVKAATFKLGNSKPK